ncbi:DNA primase [Cystobacter fuscus]|uniref:DNA primase n=1 Tax=Cystobacter fuscus TaxID=43 RepID=A0A250J674_9BACT|nr:DNA primase [Cystobacter fuscus]ATB39038.1 DNA primase [Cystobacter fuscus]
MSVKADVEEILGRIDIGALLSRYLELRREDEGYRGKCPFHVDEAASFHVLPRARVFRCTSCLVEGNALVFLQRYLGLSFDDAVRQLAGEAGVSLQAYDPFARERKQCQEACDLAAEHYRACLADPGQGKRARAYLEERGVQPERIQAFGLGWAPSDGDSLTRVLERVGLREAGVKVGLLSRTGQAHADAYRGRIMLPIHSREGRTSAFMGRLVEGEGVKYLMPEVTTLTYDEGKALYGLELARAKIGRSGCAVLVEGSFDCIWMHQAGFGNTVALYPNTLTPMRMKLLEEAGARELIFLLDGDVAGRRAVEWNSAAVFTQGIATRVALLPEGQDPDTHAMREGTEGVRRLLDSARPLMEHVLESLQGAVRAASLEDPKVHKRVYWIVRNVPRGPARTTFLERLSASIGLTSDELESRLFTRARG